MNKQQRIKELDELIAKAQAEREQLANEKTLWVPEGKALCVTGTGEVITPIVSCESEFAKFGHAAPDKEKAEQLRDFFAELVPKHPVPEVGQEYWVLVTTDCEPGVTTMKWVWKGGNADWLTYNLGRTWLERPTPEEIDRKRKVLAFDSSWRWV